MKNLGLGDLSVLAYGLNLAGYWPPCFKNNEKKGKNHILKKYLKKVVVTCPAKLHNPKLKAGIFNEKIPDLSPNQ